MEKKVLGTSAFLGVFISLVLVLAACAPAITPGTAPREISSGSVFIDETIAETPTEGLIDESKAISDAATLEDVLARLDNIAVPALEEDFSGVAAAPVEGQIEEHMVTEFSTGVIGVEDVSLAGIESAPVEGLFEEHMVTEFPTGIVSLEDEFLSAYGLAPVEGQLEEDLIEASPVEGLLEENLIEAVLVEGQLEEEVAPEAALEEGQIEEHMVTEFFSGMVSSLDEEFLGIESAPVEGLFEEHMVTEFPIGIVSLEDEFLAAYGLDPVEGQLEENLVPDITSMQEQIDTGLTDYTMMDDYYENW